MRLAKAVLATSIMAATLLVALSAAGSAQEAGADATWQALKPDIFGERPVADAGPLVTLTAPIRAEDAAMVPIEIAVALPPGDSRTVEKLTLIVDENPAPVAATFTFGGERHDLALATRIRVNSYSYVRAVAQLSDGSLQMAQRYVKASGGCSAPAMKDEEAALRNIGQMKMRLVQPGQLGDATKANRFARVQLMIRHPNYSGLQMDQITRLYIPAKYVDRIEVKQGDALILSMEGGISLSEDPNLQFSFEPTGQQIHVDAGDTDGRTFEGELKPAG
ncbi:quinoprotein dehydrogenase-associated SoxYZ-like carrier [Ancylobacter defluvii]|uniref:Quinoprotein dehydrogenase-associated SoxYZ-like carrier n=1 Tax=Ancylobacter defluvii TaxID=1282440 RepID=A0A9W6NB42_9HYPH|nr:quinoprotein dehydrogenase-associated SoxYZ-like carrier [Ancylobacter defluvii]MBS7585936.1 quinoprotein dehydrogenase-associated SoxYZ-like carrier [Ancylobacter defluvii]GLK84313.1 quinoprotein dehydrogenase-associated SoxYZ-like carrier [Ancylobacter defluvii]